MRINPFFLATTLMIVAVGCKPGDPGSGSDSGGGQKATGGLKELKIVDTKVGTGAPVADGDDVYVWYTGSLMNGKVFDTNRKDKKSVFHVTVGGGQVIKGWDMGLKGMKQGGKRKLTIPSAYAYGAKGTQGIPPDSDLVFEIELQNLVKKEDRNSILANDTKVGQGRKAKLGDTISVDYVAHVNGEEIDNRKGVVFKIGAGEMQIDGFDKALIGMQVGGERKILLPPGLAHQVRSEKIGMNISDWEVTLKKIF